MFPVNDCFTCTSGGDGNLSCPRNLLIFVYIKLKFPIYDCFTSGGGGNFELSTGFGGYTPVFGGVSAMTNDGYGCFYHMEQN